MGKVRQFNFAMRKKMHKRYFSLKTYISNTNTINDKKKGFRQCFLLYHNF